MNPQILLIEGEESQAFAVQRILEPVGYEVVWATTLQDVIDFLSQSEKPVVVSSLRFDPLDVFSLLRWLVVNRPQARLIILSDGDVPPIRANGAIGFVARAALSRLRALSSDALMGHLPAVSFADLIDVLCLLVLTKSTQRLHVIFDQEQGQLYIKQGQILHAQTDSKVGIPAFADILGWTGGGVYELTWEEPASQSLSPDEAEVLLLGAQRTTEPSAGSLLSILEDAVERSIEAAPVPALMSEPPLFAPIEQDFVAPQEAAHVPSPKWPAAVPEQISDAIQQALATANKSEEPPLDSSAEVSAPPLEVVETTPEPEPPSEPVADTTMAMLHEETARAIQTFSETEPKPSGQTRQEILVQEVLLENSPLAGLLHAQHPPLQQKEAPSRQNTKTPAEVNPQDAVSSEMEETALDGADPGPSHVVEDAPTNDGDVWAELSHEMESNEPPSNAPSPFEPPKLLVERPAEPTKSAVPFIQTPSYRDVAAQKVPDEAPTEPNLQVTQTPPMGLRISGRAQGQPYTITTPPSGTAAVKAFDRDNTSAALRTPPMGTRIVTSAKTPPMGNPIHHVTPVGVAPVMPTPQRTTPSGAYLALSPAYREAPVANVEPNMFSDHATPPFGTRIPRGQNAETPHAPTGSPLANAARSALHEKPPAPGASEAIVGLVPVLQEVAREVPEFIAAIAIEADSGLALGGVTSREALDAESGFAYYTEVLRLLRPALALFDASLEELLVTSPKWYVLLRPLRDEFFLGLITTRKGNLGICRIVLKRAATQLIERLPAREAP